MTAVDFDLDTFLDGLESVSTFSTTTTTSPTTTENDSDSGIATTPPMSTDFDNTVVDLDNLNIPSLDMAGQFFNDPEDEFNWFSSTFFNEKNPSMPCENSTFEALFPDVNLFEQENQEPLQQIPSQSPDIPAINNVIKLQSCSNNASIGPKCIKLEPKNTSITIIPGQKTITVTKVPVIPISVPTASSKRRREDSPVNYQQITELPTLTLEQLKRQYGNMSDEALKKHLRMIKNRESASLSRKRRKELMENLDDRAKNLTEENEQLKTENSRLLTRIETLEMENEILKRYYHPDNPTSQPRKPLILMGVVLLVVFNVFTLKALTPMSTNPTNSIALYNHESAVVPGRTILSDRRSSSYVSNNERDYGPDETSANPSKMPNYPFIQCVAYINKTHSQRINQDLRSWVEDNEKKQQNNEPVVIPNPNSLTIPSNPSVHDSSMIPVQHQTRKVARQTKLQSESKGQLQPYQTSEADYDEFIQTIDRKNDTLYFISFKRDHLILPAMTQNQTQRPKMSLVLPASMANLNKSIHVPHNHVPMIKIDCEVEDTKLVFVKQSHVPSSYRNELFEYYSSIPQASI